MVKSINSPKKKSEKMVKVLLCGACMSGNMGGQALYISMVESLEEILGKVQVTILSKYPNDDRKPCEALGWLMVSYPSSVQILLGIPFSFIFAFFRLLRIPGNWFARGPFSHYINNDILIDLSGISFTDDRSISGLIINCLWLLPAIATGIPYVKASQAMGPFSKPLVKVASRFFLYHAEALIARGAKSAEYLGKFFPNRKIYELPDVAFALKPASKVEVDKVLADIGLKPGQPFCAIGPSLVLNNLMKSQAMKASYPELMAKIVTLLSDLSGLPVLLIPHERAHTGSVFDDIYVCEAIYKKLNRPQNVKIINKNYTASVLKGIIARSEVAIGSRFHFMVAAMSSGVPGIAIAWSHKYYEMMGMVGQGYFVVSYKDLNQEAFLGKVKELWEKRKLVHNEIVKYLPDVIKNARYNANIVKEVLNNRKIH